MQPPKKHARVFVPPGTIPSRPWHEIVQVERSVVVFPACDQSHRLRLVSLGTKLGCRRAEPAIAAALWIKQSPENDMVVVIGEAKPVYRAIRRNQCRRASVTDNTMLFDRRILDQV